MASRLDTIIIGAGAAGLAAARDLSGSGKSLTILEARPRIGGRMFTLHDPNSALPIELGAEFIHGEAEETFKIVEAGALLAYELPDDHWWSGGGQRPSAFRQIHDFWATVKNVRQKIPAHAHDISFADFLKKQKSISPRLA